MTALPELVLALEGTAFVVRPGNWGLHWERNRDWTKVLRKSARIGKHRRGKTMVCDRS